MPNNAKRIVCLANSRKPDGRCVAGKEFDGGKVGPWIRPVSARPGGEVSEHERHYENGSDPKVLDVLNIPLIKPKPKAHQKENWLLDPDAYWAKEGRIQVSDLAAMVDSPTKLWMNERSTFNGLNDSVPEVEAAKLEASLYLIRVKSLVLRVFVPGAKFNNPKRRVQGQFEYRNTTYWLWVTDPNVERTFLAKDNGEYPLGPCYLTISLGEPFKDECYKLIATVFESPK